MHRIFFIAFVVTTSLSTSVSGEEESNKNEVFGSTLIGRPQKRCNQNSEVILDHDSRSCASDSKEITTKRGLAYTAKIRTTTKKKVIPRGPFYDYLIHICDALLNHFKANRIHKYFNILGKSLDGLGSGFFMKMEIDRFVRLIKKRSVYSAKKLKQYVINFVNIISSGRPMMNEFFYAMNSIFTIYDDNKMDDYVYLLRKYGKKEIDIIGDRTRWMFKEFIFGKFQKQKYEISSDIKLKLKLANIEYEKTRNINR